ncbi:shikimate kinase [Bradyrhizobium sp. USDA 4524]|uniref:shikimate kinase n=1 Tax=unclassified Bradyrhizobium TaxID=2631580 RepID=UPI0020A074AA|nr:MULTISPECIES: shikimate kinase [unclassified Bradyrhizobium]MCP1845976.1 shikimate kinase [Bradyrhizobium sp. USDA 4538]MCP1907390.1 shikimate kinase [Bradyrhizobium sp. USDA 4537]MCP1985176.1 shikimate kinase [Bradyrhizobium sp. USDA 4539]
MIVLVGMPGCGKSALARAYAGAKGLPRYDTDEILRERHGDILGPAPSERRWQEFRWREAALVDELSSRQEGILALGGGAWEAGRHLLLSKHLCVYLECEHKILIERLMSGDRVMFSATSLEQQARELLKRREAIYRLAHRTIDASEPLMGLVFQLSILQQDGLPAAVRIA